MGWLEDLLNQDNEPQDMMSMSTEQTPISMGGLTDRPVSAMDTLPDMSVSKKAPMPLKKESIEADTDPKVDKFMKMNGISDRNEAIQILKKSGKL